MYQTVSFDDFRDAFRSYDRLDNFSYEGAKALFDYLEEYEESTGEKIEFDVIALCVDYTERDLKETLEDYSLSSIEELQDNTTVIIVDDETIIYQNY